MTAGAAVSEQFFGNLVVVFYRPDAEHIGEVTERPKVQHWKCCVP